MAALLQPDPYILVLTGAGLLIALVAWLLLALKRLPLLAPSAYGPFWVLWFFCPF